MASYREWFRAEAECIEAGDPFVTALSRFDHAIVDYTYNWSWLGLSATEGWQRAAEEQINLGLYEIGTLNRWWALRVPEDGIA